MEYYQFDCGCKFPIERNGRVGIKLNITKAPLTCKRTWDLISSGMTKGVFQLESSLGKQWTKRLKPENIEHLTALGALLRPGCVAKGTRVAISVLKDRANDAYQRNLNCEWIKIEELYKKWHRGHVLYKPSIVSIDEDNLLAYNNRITSVVYSGDKAVYRPIFKLEKRNRTSNRYALQCTLDHPLLTHDRGWVELQYLTPGDYIAVSRRLPNQPKHKQNFLGEKNYRTVCFQNYKYTCLFCDWHEATLDVNHIDGNRKTNNHADNLCFLCPNHHKMYTEGYIAKELIVSTKAKYKLRNTKHIQWVQYVGMKSMGMQPTYDISVEGPNHNFIADNVVVHNCLRAVDEDGISMTEHYCRRKNGEEPVEIFHPALDDILRPTYGVLTYQEQAMRIAQVIANFNLQDADELRKAIGKKLPEEMEKVRVKFMAGCEQAKIVTLEEATQIFGWIKESQRYSFNKCVRGDTVIRRMFKGRYPCVLTVEEMYKIRNDITYAKKSGHISLYKKWKLLGHYGTGLSMSADGRVRPNIIKNISVAGKKVTYRVTTESGLYIDVTSNHKFPTPNGIKTTLDLKEIYVCGEYEITNFNQLGKFSSFTIKDIRQKTIVHDGREGFMTGENNPAFTNGAYTEFITNSSKLPMCCQLCSAINCRLEVHHKSGDRSNNSVENICRLCSSCHKKEEYKLGRTKVGEKGYPVKVEKVVSIVANQVSETFDITMEEPNHNFIANDGIITCNSHAACYALNGYYSAYCKAHFPVQTYTSWLFHAPKKQAKKGENPKREVRDLINEAKLMNIDVLPPDIFNLKAHFHTDGKIITFGLSDIKSVGTSIVTKIKDIVATQEIKHNSKMQDWSWFQFLVRIGPIKQEVGRIGESALANLISAGALRNYESNRTKMLAELKTWAKLSAGEANFIYTNSDKFTNLLDALKAAAPLKKEGGACHSEERKQTVKSLISLLEHPPTKLEDSPNWIAGTEEILLGIAITCSRIDACDTSAINATCRDFVDGNIKNQGSIILGIEIQSMQEIKTKKGKTPGSKMARLIISDGTCAIDTVCWPETYKEIGHLFTESNTLIVQGYKDRKQGSFVIQKAWQAELSDIDT